MTIYDLARMTRQTTDDDVTQLTTEQEQALAADPLVLTYFYLMVTGRTPEAIADEFGLDDMQTNTMLVRLSRLKLVELFPTNTGRLLTSNRIRWRTDGPIERMYRKQVEQAFLDSQFNKADETFRFEMAELSEASAKIIERKLDRLIRELGDYAELDLTAERDAKLSYGLLLGFRPWTFWRILEGTANDMGLNAERSQAIGRKGICETWSK